MSTRNRVADVLASTRQTGLTTSLVAIAKLNPKAIIVVRNHRMKTFLTGAQHMSDNQVWTVSDLIHRSYGFNFGPILFDSCAIMEVMERISEEYAADLETKKEVIRVQDTIIDALKTRIREMSTIITAIRDTVNTNEHKEASNG